jgi:hypothetical protein
MSDQAKFWFWIVVLAATCLFLGAVLASAARAQGEVAGWTAGKVIGPPPAATGRCLPG